MKKIFTWLIDKWLAGFVTASIAFVAKLYVDLPLESKSKFFNFEWFKQLMATQFSLSTVIIIVLLIIIFTRIEKAVLKKNSIKSIHRPTSPPENQFENYCKDIFGVNKTTWTWQYEWNSYSKRFAIDNLKPSCKICQTPMELDNYSFGYASCHKCRLEGKSYSSHIHEDISDVSKEIVRRIENREANLSN